MSGNGLPGGGREAVERGAARQGYLRAQADLHPISPSHPISPPPILSLPLHPISLPPILSLSLPSYLSPSHPNSLPPIQSLSLPTNTPSIPSLSLYSSMNTDGPAPGFIERPQSARRKLDRQTDRQLTLLTTQ